MARFTGLDGIQDTGRRMGGNGIQDTGREIMEREGNGIQDAGRKIGMGWVTEAGRGRGRDGIHVQCTMYCIGPEYQKHNYD